MNDFAWLTHAFLNQMMVRHRLLWWLPIKCVDQWRAVDCMSPWNDLTFWSCWVGGVRNQRLQSVALVHRSLLTVSQGKTECSYHGSDGINLISPSSICSISFNYAESITVANLSRRHLNTDASSKLTFRICEGCVILWVNRCAERQAATLSFSFLLPFPSIHFKRFLTQPSCHDNPIHAACFLMLQSTQKTPLLLLFDCHRCTKPGGCFPQGALSNKGIQPTDFEVPL